MTIDQFIDRVNSNIPTEGQRVEGDFSVFAQTGLPFYVLVSGNTVSTPVMFEGKNGMKYLGESQQLDISKPGPKTSWSSIRVFQSEGEYQSVEVQVFAKNLPSSTKTASMNNLAGLPSLGNSSMSSKRVNGVKGYIESDNELLDGAEILIPMDAFSITELSDVNLSEVSSSVASYLLENNVPVELTASNVIGAWETGSDNIWKDYFIKGIKPNAIQSDDESLSFEDFKEMKLVDIDSFKSDSLRFDARIKEIVDVSDQGYIGESISDDFVLVEINNGPGTTFSRTALVQLPSSLENPAILKNAESSDQQEKIISRKQMIIYLAGAIALAFILYLIFRKK